MHCHPNAPLTPRGRLQLIETVTAGVSVSAGCAGAGVSRTSFYKWAARYAEFGVCGLVDRSSAPHSKPHRLTPDERAQVVATRLAHGWGADRIASFLGLAASTVHRALRSERLVGRPARPAEPVRRYEYTEPGGLVHFDTKKLGRIQKGPGHRAHGDRRRKSGRGWEVLHMAIDDCTRLVFAEILEDETKETTALFMARALRWFADQGITPQRVLTDNGPAYRSQLVAHLLEAKGLKHRLTRPYHPQTNGKAERWIQTVLRECLYRLVFTDGESRRVGLARFLLEYNERRPHRGLAGLTPRARLRAALASVEVEAVAA